MKYVLILISLSVFNKVLSQQSIVVLGIAQDGGFPHIGCQRECQLAHNNPALSRYVTSLALIDEKSKQWWLFEATPDMDKQLHLFQQLTNGQFPYLPEAIFLTHAHIGHYSGLMYLGREALGSNNTKVYALPRLIAFLSTNGPWSQLVTLGNITTMKLAENQAVPLSPGAEVSAFRVPHRDEFSETAGYRIKTDSSSYLFIPDIDKWEKWDQDIISLVKGVDHAFLDATFLKDGELPYRAMSLIPHPFVEETMKLFETEPMEVKNKIKFIHLNHTNPLLFDEDAKEEVLEKGFRITNQGEQYH